MFLNKFKFSMKNKTKKRQKKVQIIRVGGEETGGGQEEEVGRRKTGVTFWVPRREMKSSR